MTSSDPSYAKEMIEAILVELAYITTVITHGRLIPGMPALRSEDALLETFHEMVLGMQAAFDLEDPGEELERLFTNTKNQAELIRRALSYKDGVALEDDSVVFLFPPHKESLDEIDAKIAGLKRP